MTYREKLRDPRWQQLRLMVMQRDGWRCQSVVCAANRNPRVMLVVHHKRYIAGREPWDYAPDDLITLCVKCHDSIHEVDEPEAHLTLVKGRCYHWREIKQLVGHEPYGYLTQVGQSIVCGCFRADFNPDAPGIVLPGGNDPQWVAKARLFQRQGTSVPVFVKVEGLPWEFVGQFRVEAMTQNPVEIQIHRERHHFDDIGAVVFLCEG
jgi:hypothetical protein